jgi:hypothetical protein
VIKCKIADCLSILVSFEKKQRIREFIFKIYDLSLNQYVLKGLATVFSLGSIRCEFQIFLHFIISGRVLYHVICPDLLRIYLVTLQLFENMAASGIIEFKLGKGYASHLKLIRSRLMLHKNDFANF